MRARTVVLGLAFAATALVSSCATALAIWINPPEKPRPPLLQNLSATYKDASVALTQRLRKDFPVGSNEADLTDTLAAQGFVPAWQSPPGHRLAYLDMPRFICGSEAMVQWSTDQAGRLTSIDGQLSDDGCP